MHQKQIMKSDDKLTLSVFNRCEIGRGRIHQSAIENPKLLCKENKKYMVEIESQWNENGINLALFIFRILWQRTS